MTQVHITFDSKEAEEKLLADKKFVTAMTNLINLAENMNSRVGAEVSENTAAKKQAFYVKAKIQSKEDLKCVFITDHVVHLGDLPINEIEHAITDEIERRLIEREDGKYTILAIEKIIVALDNPPEI